MNLENHVFKGDPELAVCDWMECSSRGEYRRCYFIDLFKLCPMNITHRNYLKTIQKMRDKYGRKREPGREGC